MHPLMPAAPRLALMPSDTDRAHEAADTLREMAEFVPLDEADVLIVLGGDGHMLHCLHHMLDAGRVIPAYGLNYGTIGFMMNKPKSSRTLEERIARARPLVVTPLEMVATTGAGPRNRSARSTRCPCCAKPARPPSWRCR